MLLLVVGVSPMLAPAIGGYVSEFLGWHYIFIILTVLAAIILAASYWALPESYKPDPSYSLMPAPIIRSFLFVIREPRFTTYALSGAIVFAGLLSYVAGSPYVFLEIFKVSGTQYSLIFALLAAGLIGSGQINSLLLRKYKSEQIILVALFFQAIVGVILVTGSSNGWLGLAGTLATIFIFLSCAGFIFPNASALSMAPFAQHAGSASALMGALQMGIGALASVGVSVLSKSDHSAFPMTGVMAGCSLLALCILLTGSRIIRSRTAAARAQEQLSDAAA
jgi:DHA1 family bicyclomycin/chloramphenicol resistance-like MFS transporter